MKRPSNESGYRTRKLERFDLTGRRISRWTVRSCRRLSMLVGSIFRRIIAYRDPASQESVGEKIQENLVKTLDHVGAKLDEPTIENQLRVSQTEAEFAKCELTRVDAQKRRAEVQSVVLANLERQLAIAERIKELTDGKTDLHIRIVGEVTEVLVASIPSVTERIPDETPLLVEDLCLNLKTETALKSHGVQTVSDLVEMTSSDVLSITGIGPKFCSHIDDRLADVGLRLKGEVVPTSSTEE